MKRSILATALLLAFGQCVDAQVPPPRYESRLRHLFRPHRDAENIAQRFADLKCALVVIRAGQRTGTGFFIDSDGTILTAAHVLAEKQFSLAPNGTINVTLLRVPNDIAVTSTAGGFTVHSADLELNANQWLVDLAVIKTNRKTKCWLQFADDSKVFAGQHILAMGFPGLAFGSLSVYSGIVSARLRLEVPMAKTVEGMALNFPNDFFRLQVPISRGISGGPVIDDENRVVGVITSAGMWSSDLEALIQADQIRDSLSRAAPNQPAGQNRSIDWIAATARLAGIFRDWSSPGYGDAVPVGYLKRPSKAATEKHGKGDR